MIDGSGRLQVFQEQTAQRTCYLVACRTGLPRLAERPS
jgi:hypothetical protein